MIEFRHDPVQIIKSVLLIKFWGSAEGRVKPALYSTPANLIKSCPYLTPLSLLP
jgi:hypothetical protein